jgi:tRNA-intron endonuclease
MPGRLVDDSVVIADAAEASQIYNKGFYGYPTSGGGLELDLLEAIYLVECDRLPVAGPDGPASLPSLIRVAANHQKDFEIRYIVYRDLRQRGYVVKPDAGDFDFRVFPRGGTPSTTQTKYWVMAISERATFDIEAMIAQTEGSERTRKELLIAIVDEEGDITYYRASTGAPRVPLHSEKEDQVATGLMLEDRVLVLDENESRELYNHGFFGKQIGKTLQISLIETAFLLDEGRIIIRSSESDKRVRPGSFRKHAREIQSDFDLRLQAYADLRARGLVVKTGFKYGSHFRVYDGDPSSHHSKYLVHAVPAHFTSTWPEISRAVRLAHGVKKDIIFACVADKGLQYVRLRRVRP